MRICFVYTLYALCFFQTALAEQNVSSRIGKAVTTYMKETLSNVKKDMSANNSRTDASTFSNIITTVISDLNHAMQLSNSARDVACLRKLRTEYENLLGYINEYETTSDKELVAAYINDCLFDIQFVTSQDNTTGITYQAERNMYTIKNKMIHTDNNSVSLLSRIEQTFCKG